MSLEYGNAQLKIAILKQTDWWRGANRSLTDVLYTYMNKEHNWDNFVEYAISTLSTTQQSTTKAVPFELVYGRPVDLLRETHFHNLWQELQHVRKETFNADL